MSDVQILFAILGALYAWECAGWLRRGGVAFSTWAGKHWRAQHPATMLGNQTGGFIWAAPIPPLGEIFYTHQLPFSLGPDGVLFFVSANVNRDWRPHQSGRFFSWEQISVINLSGKTLQLKDETLFSTPTVTLAHQLHQMLTTMAKQPAEQRVRDIKKLLVATFDLKQMEAIIQNFRQQVRLIRALANALFVVVFIVAPILIWSLGLHLVWHVILFCILAITISAATLFNRMHRKLYPIARDDRFTQTLILAFAPATTMRAHDIASRPLLENFHPLTAAKHFLPAESFRLFARRVLLDLRQPALPWCPNPQPQAIATESFFRKTYLEIVEAWLAEQKLSPDDLCRPPAPLDESCRTYCPRCEAQFTTPDGRCTDCGGLALVVFAKAS